MLLCERVLIFYRKVLEVFIKNELHTPLLCTAFNFKNCQIPLEGKEDFFQVD